MTTRREDLAAAAALGLLQYRQIDPLLVFLLQRDVYARRQAMLHEREERRSGVLTWLTCVMALLATVTGGLFALLLTSRGAQLGSGALLLFLIAYACSAFSAAVLVRARGYGRRTRMASAALMASVPLAVFAIQQAA
jgi:predicted permease